MRKDIGRKNEHTRPLLWGPCVTGYHSNVVSCAFMAAYVVKRSVHLKKVQRIASEQGDEVAVGIAFGAIE